MPVDNKKREELRAAIRRGDYGALVRKPGETAPKEPQPPAKKGPPPLPAQAARPAGSLAVLIRTENRVPMEEALLRAKETKTLIASNRRMERALINSQEWQDVRDGLPCWTGTIVAYEEPGKAFGKIVEYTDPKTGFHYVFPVPPQFVGVRDGLLVAEHPGIRIENDGDDKIVRAAKVGLIERFPAAGQKWYRADPIFRIPHGPELSEDQVGTAFLWRSEKNVCLVVRSYRNPLTVDLNSAPSDVFGVIIEINAANAPKK